MSGELMPAAVEGEIVERGGAVRPWQTQADRDRVLEDADEIFATIGKALAPNTVAAYKAQWRRYLKWCGEHGRTPLPASRETLLSYLKDMKRDDMAVSTMHIAMAALKRVHSWGGDAAPEWVGGHQEITDFIVGYGKERASAGKHPKRAAGARQVIMRLLLDALPEDKAYGVRDRAVLLLGYYMAARRSELAALRVQDLRTTVDGLEVYVARSKTDQGGLGAWVAVPENDEHPEYDPATALGAWLDLRGRHDGPLFVPINRYDKLVDAREPMSGQAFEVLMSRAVQRAYAKAKAQLEQAKAARRPKAIKDAQRVVDLLNPEKVQLSPHSLRRGFATDARASAWDLLDITRHGRWSPQSKAVHIYIEEADRWLRLQNKPVML